MASNTNIATLRQVIEYCGKSLRASDFKYLVDFLSDTSVHGGFFAGIALEGTDPLSDYSFLCNHFTAWYVGGYGGGPYLHFHTAGGDPVDFSANPGWQNGTLFLLRYDGETGETLVREILVGGGVEIVTALSGIPGDGSDVKVPSERSVNTLVGETRGELEEVLGAITAVLSGSNLVEDVTLAGDTLTITYRDASTSSYTIGGYTLPVASSSTLGGIKVGTGLTIDSDTGILSANGGGGESYTAGDGIAISGSNVISARIDGTTLKWDSDGEVLKGGYTAGTGIAIDTSGTIRVTSSGYNTLGGIASIQNIYKSNPSAGTWGTGLYMSANIMEPYSNFLLLKPASKTAIGGIIVGSGLNVTDTGTSGDFATNPSGILSVAVDDSTIIINSDGELEATAGYTLPVASTSVLGGILSAEASVSRGYDIDSVTGELTARVASSGTLGLVMPGYGISVTSSGSLSVKPGEGLSVNSTSNALEILPASIEGGVAKLGGFKIVTGTDSGYSMSGGTLTLTLATSEKLGIVKVDGTTITSTDGVISATGGGGGGYTLPVASSSTLGGIKIGTGLDIDSSGTVSAVTYNLPVATTTTLGGVIVPTSTGSIQTCLGIASDGSIKLNYSSLCFTPLGSTNSLSLKVGDGLEIDPGGTGLRVNVGDMLEITADDALKVKTPTSASTSSPVTGLITDVSGGSADGMLKVSIGAGLRFGTPGNSFNQIQADGTAIAGTGLKAESAEAPHKVGLDLPATGASAGEFYAIQKTSNGWSWVSLGALDALLDEILGTN